MKLTDLAPIFLAMPEGQVMPPASSIAEAEGIRFRCPVCRDHTIICWQPNVDPDFPPRPGRWWLRGTGFADLTLEGQEGKGSSVLLTGGCLAHFLVRGGSIEVC